MVLFRILSEFRNTSLLQNFPQSSSVELLNRKLFFVNPENLNESRD